MNIPTIKYIEREKIGLKNYKVFKELQEIEIAPITILTGTNSSGKSSFVKAIKLIKENFNVPNKSFQDIDNLDFQKPSNHLGGFDHVLSDKAEENDQNIYFSTNFINDIWGKLKCELVYEENKNSNLKKAKLKQLNIYTAGDNDIVPQKIATLSKIKIDFPKVDNKENIIEHWDLDFNYHIGITLLMKFKDFGALQERVSELNKTINSFNLKEKKNKDILNRLDTNDKAFFQELIKEGLIPYTNELIINETNPFFDCSINKNYQLYDSDMHIISWNSTACKLNKYAPNKNVLLPFPLLDTLEWNAIFDDEGILSTAIFEKEKKNTEIDLNFAYEIYDQLKGNNIGNIEDANTLIQEKSNLIIKKYITQFLNIDNFKIFDPELGNEYNDFNIPGELKNNIDELTNTLNSLSAKSIIEQIPFDDFENLLVFSKDDKSSQCKAKLKNYIDYIDLVLKQFTIIINQSFQAFSNFSDFEFISSDRVLNQRLFLDADKSEFNQLMINFIEPKKVKRGRYGYPLSLNERTKFVKKWLNKLEIADNFKIERDPDGIGTRAYLENDGHKELLADVGFGINRLFPLLLKIATSDSNSVLFIEEPESNLHPNLQSKISDMLMDAFQKFHHRFVLETHSEYLIRKLQYLVANNKTILTPNSVNIYYFYHPDEIPNGKNQIEKLNIRPDGGLDNEFGEGFVDEAINLKFDLMRMMKARDN